MSEARRFVLPIPTSVSIWDAADVVREVIDDHLPGFDSGEFGRWTSAENLDVSISTTVALEPGMTYEEVRAAADSQGLDVRILKLRWSERSPIGAVASQVLATLTSLHTYEASISIHGDDTVKVNGMESILKRAVQRGFDRMPQAAGEPTPPVSPQVVAASRMTNTQAGAGSEHSFWTLGRRIGAMVVGIAGVVSAVVAVLGVVHH